METERRQHPRKKPERLVYVEQGADNGGMMRDLSEGGIGFRVVSPVRQGEKVKFAFAFDGVRRLEGQGNLVWTDGEGKAGGLRFTNVSEAFREAIRIWKEKKTSTSTLEREAAPAAVLPLPTLEDLRKEIRREDTQPAEVLSPNTADASAKVPIDVPAGAPAYVPTAKEMGQTPPVMEMAELLFPTEESEEVKGIEPGLGESKDWEAAIPEVQPPEEMLRVPQEPPESLQEEMAGTNWLEHLTLSWAIGMMLALTLIATGVVYHRALGESLIWLGEKIAGETAPAGTMVPEQSLPSAGSAVESGAPPKKSQASKAVSPALALAQGAPDTASRESTTHGNEPQTNQDPGQPEFLQALAILRGKNRSGELPDAVRLLWIAVEKGNSSAEVALADLFRRGEGMAQNCDQARVLLTAAAKKGNTEAKNRLAQLQQQGCP